MSLAKTKKKKRRKKLFSTVKPKIRKNYFTVYSEKQIEHFNQLSQHDADLYSSYSTNTIIIGFDEVGRGCVAGPVSTGAYSCSNFYKDNKQLISEVKRAAQLSSGNFLSLNDRDLYYSVTVVNEETIEDELQEVQELSALILLDDSKKVLKSKRKQLCQSLIDVPCFDSEHHLFHSTNFQSASFIDKHGIVKAIWQSMVENLINIVIQHIDFYSSYPEELLLLVDGSKTIQNLTELCHEELKKRKIIDFSFIELGLDSKQSRLDLKTKKGEIIIRQKNIIRGDSKSALIAAASNLAKNHRDDYMKELALKETHYAWDTNVGYGTKKHMDAIQKHGLTKEHRKTFLSSHS